MLPYKAKLRIMKKFEISSTWRRFKEVGKLILENNSIITTEAQLCKYIYDHWGEGRYMILSWAPKQEGFIRFWLGFVYSNGFCRDIDKNKEMERLKAQLAKAKSFEDREIIEDDLNFEREIAEVEKTLPKRRGPYCLIKSRPGQLNPYEEY